MCLDLNINLDSNLLLKAAYFIWWEEVGHICLPLHSVFTLWNSGAPAAALGFLMKMQGNRKQGTIQAYISHGFVKSDNGAYEYEF